MQICEESLVTIHEIQPFEANILETKSVVLATSKDFEISQVLLNSGESFDFAKSLRERTIQVLSGRAILSFEDHPFAMIPGQLARLAAGTDDRFEAVDATSALCTLVLPETEIISQEDSEPGTLDQALEDSFPASDPRSIVVA